MHRHVPVREVVLDPIEVDFSLDWSEAIFRSGKDSDPELYLFRVGEQYKSGPKSIRSVVPHLLGFPKSWTTELALEVLTDRNLRPAHPRVAFTLGEKLHGLPQLLNTQFVALVSLIPCQFRVGANDVNFITRTFVSDIWRESRLVPRSHIFEGYCWTVGEKITNA